MTHDSGLTGPSGAAHGTGLIAALAALAVDAPDGLIDRVAARWVTVQGPLGELRAAFTDHGVAYLRPEPPAPPVAAGAPGVGTEPGSVREDEAGSGAAGSSPAGEAGGGAVAVGGFAEEFRRRVGRPLLPGARPPAGLVPALRTGRTSGVPLDLRACGAFEREVLLAVRSIPRGEIRPYAWVAARTGRPAAAARAVAGVLARNPVPLLVPCHRVTGAGGVLGTYVLGPLAQERLLRAEGVDLERVRELAGRRVYYLASDTTGIVCLPTCHNARRITPRHRRGFRSVAQARAAGYRPCRSCHPTPGLTPEPA
ncbi:methylated-DNA--[protein]-cysteine S-methyltransferase [Nonomuraea pusilla]|uniref:methylated-DNA--[protein]-cysteine S-methyltransferase n=1 Tax=Nonomuraea pusilla TaxID=46177 RepID=UPI00332876E4